VKYLGDDIICGYETFFAKISQQHQSGQQLVPFEMFQGTKGLLSSPAVAVFSFLNGLLLCFQGITRIFQLQLFAVPDNFHSHLQTMGS